MGINLDITPDLKNVFHLAKVLADLPNVPIRIAGPTGVGKNVIARVIHDLSPRKDSPFVHFDVTHLSADLILSQLFGHKRGSFTGAAQDHQGAIEEAEGGTLFLDEIGDLDPSMQAKFLRFLSDRTYRPLGAKADLAANVRVIAATSKDLWEEVRAKRFREDLFYRLDQGHLFVPPLKDRPNDILGLSRLFAQKAAADNNQSNKKLSDDFMNALQNYAWPGNIRELEAVIIRSFIRALCDGSETIELHHFEEDPNYHGLPLISGSTGITGKEVWPFKTFDEINDVLKESQKVAIFSALREAHFVINNAGVRLGLDPRQMKRKLATLFKPLEFKSFSPESVKNTLTQWSAPQDHPFEKAIADFVALGTIEKITNAAEDEKKRLILSILDANGYEVLASSQQVRRSDTAVRKFLQNHNLIHILDRKGRKHPSPSAEMP